MAKRRQYGTGSVYQRASDGRWIGSIQAGWTERNTRRVITVSAKTEAEAKRRLRDKQREIEKNGFPEAGGHITVKAFAEQWIEHQATRLRPKTLEDYRGTISRWIVPTIGHRTLDRLTPGDVRALTTAVRDAGRSSTTARHHQVVLMVMLRAAIRDGHRVPERLLHLEAPKAATNDRAALDIEQARALLLSAAEHRDGSRWVAALLQGMRQGECLGLTWQCVDLESEQIDVSWQLQRLKRKDGHSRTSPLVVPDGYEHRILDGTLCLVRPKTSSGWRIIPLVPWMTAALKAWREVAPESPHGLVWPRADGQPRRAEVDREQWKALQAAAGIAHASGREFVGHEARHTTATLLLEAGVDPHTVTAILGHSSITTSRGYQHVSTTLARQAMEAVAARLELRG